MSCEEGTNVPTECSTGDEVRFVPTWEHSVEERPAAIDALICFQLDFPTVADRFSTFPRDATHIRDLSQKYVCRATIKLNVIFVFLFPLSSVFVLFYNCFPSALI
jgi:hypothetical protein